MKIQKISGYNLTKPVATKFGNSTNEVKTIPQNNSDSFNKSTKNTTEDTQKSKHLPVDIMLLDLLLELSSL